ncbi:MAG: hypothetical protein ACEPOZ_22400 [Marinifilaceae bacterium]
MRVLILFLGFLCTISLLSAQNTTPRNSIVVESNLIATSSIFYNRMVPINEKAVVAFGGGYIMGVGFGHGSDWLKFETSLLSYGPRHFLETGAQYIYGLNDDSSPGLKLGYRFMGKKGLTFAITANVLFTIDPVVLPTVGIGYSF